MENIIEINDISFRYEGGESPVLEGVSLKVKKGEFLALCGANGSGKSTLAKMMNAILLPESGTVSVLGMDTASEEQLYKIRERVGMVFQNPDNQIVASIVEEDVAFAPENLGVPPEEIRRRVDAAIEAVGLGRHKGDTPSKLSGGQKQRVAIAGVLAMQPDCIVLDEPTAMLDPFGRRRVLETVHRLNEELGVTVVLITHFMEEAATADRIIVLSEGKIVREGAPREVFSDAEGVRALGLDVPRATRLCRRLKARGLDIATDIVLPADCVKAIARLFEEARP
ncbi:MAG: energy-coupling factor transporter ATPase [Oscillospiraceae bacterium]|nr:energy-coupling factor transporter ATPase [Oscillospiraceae bacterium]